MSILAATDKGWLVDHNSFVRHTYSSCLSGQEERNVGHELKSDLFEICSQFKMESAIIRQKLEMQGLPGKDTGDIPSETGACSGVKKRGKKRKADRNAGIKAADDFHQQVKNILEVALQQLVELGRSRGVLVPPTQSYVTHGNHAAKHAAHITGPGDSLIDLASEATGTRQPALRLTAADKQVTDSVVNRMVHCENVRAMTTTIHGHKYLIPATCSFLLSDLTRLQSLVTDGAQYNAIVMDPPWQNKSVKRKKKFEALFRIFRMLVQISRKATDCIVALMLFINRYLSLRNDDLLELPVREVMAERECLIAVWVTNKQQHHRFIKEELFPFWGIAFQATWLWLKVTQSGEPVMALDAEGKKPYECIILGSVGDVANIPDNRVIVSVPCALHSSKPPLNDILKSFVKSEAKCLELFARNLTPGWTSWGNEVLRHQHVDFFEQVLASNT